MPRSSEKRYTTGQFAKHFDVNKDTLLYYDKIGLFRPAGVGENKYRYYTAAQADTFWALHALRQMNVPIRELHDYFDAPSPAALEQLAHKQRAVVQQQLAELARVQWLLEQMESAAREARTARLGEILLCDMPAQRLRCSARNLARGDTSQGEWSRQYDAFLEQLGLKGSAYIGSVIAREDVLAGNFARVERLFVHDEAGLFGGAPGKQGGGSTRRGMGVSTVVRPAARYAVLYCKGSYEQVQPQYPFWCARLAAMGLRVCGDVYEEYLINELAATETAEHVTKISVAVEAL